MVATLALTALLLLWSKWRYRAYALAGVFFATAAFILLTGQPLLRHWAEWPLALLIWYSGVYMLVIAQHYSMVHSEAWENERIQIDRWLSDIKREDNSEVIRFSAGNFWTDYWTYALYNPGDCWVVARFPRSTNKFGSCRVYGRDDVMIRQIPDGRHDVEIGQRKKKLFANVEFATQPPTK